MPANPLSRELAQQAVEAWMAAEYSRKEAATSLKIPVPTFVARLRKAEEYGIIASSDSEALISQVASTHSARINLSINDGIVIIGSDAHYWPGEVAPAHKAFLKVIKELKPKAVILNGDVLDGSTISRFPPIGWEKQPDLADELEECQTRLAEIRDAAPRAKRIWTAGNHDLRFETRLATLAPQFARVKGIHLKDHFPDWDTAWSAWINRDVVVKHRFKGGIHATHNNTLWTGKTIVTGHLHSLKVTPFTDYEKTRFGIDCGTLAKPYTPKFCDYTEDNAVNWVSGFVVLTFLHGELLWPEVVHLIDDHRYEFRGKVYRV